MQQLYYGFTVGLLITSLVTPCFAGMTFGDASTNQGALTLSGYVRGNFQDKDYGEPASEHKLKFDAAQIKLDYESPHIFAHAEYRCFQYDTLCDFSTLIDGYVGYRLNAQQKFTLGVQPVPFGPERFWGSNLYGSINNTIGLEDVHNLGLTYQQQIQTTTFDLGYFATDGGHYVGDTVDAARYSANFVQSGDPEQASYNEKNMWVGRIRQEIELSAIPDLKLMVGGSYWYSDLDNRTTDLTGSRKVWALFTNLGYQAFNFTLTGGKHSVVNRDVQQPNYSMMGSYDWEYEVANKGNFYTADLSYGFKDVYRGLNITPYFTYSTYQKDLASDQDSSRNILGVAFDYKKVSLIAEYLMSKNDPFIGGTSTSLAQGDDNQRNNLLNLTLFYYF